MFCGDLPQASVRRTKFYWMTHEGTLADNMLGLKTFCQNNKFSLEIVAMTSRLSKYFIRTHENILLEFFMLTPDIASQTVWLHWTTRALSPFLMTQTRDF